MPELLDCPFCGKRPFYYGYGNDKQSVGCEPCGIQYAGGIGIVDVWNTRQPTPPAVTPEAYEALRQENVRLCGERDALGRKLVEMRAPAATPAIREGEKITQGKPPTTDDYPVLGVFEGGAVTLDEADSQKFREALENPPPPNDKLVNAVTEATLEKVREVLEDVMYREADALASIEEALALLPNPKDLGIRPGKTQDMLPEVKS